MSTVIAIITICFLAILIGMAVLTAAIYKNQLRATDRERLLKNELKAERKRNGELEYNIYTLECEKDSLSSELENEREMSEILSETIEAYKARIAELEAMVDCDRDEIPQSAIADRSPLSAPVGAKRLPPAICAPLAKGAGERRKM